MRAMTALCDRCSNISWLIRSSPLRPRHICTLSETVEELLVANCWICQMFGKAVPTPRKARPPIKVLLHQFGKLELESKDKTPVMAIEDDTKEPLLYFTEKQRGVTNAWPENSQTAIAAMDPMKLWLEMCFKTHKKCTPTQLKSLPGLKMIDCLHMSVKPAPVRCHYVALSYVWGQCDLYENPPSDLEPTNLPQTIQDSIKVTLKLGYQYLWVDRYCIDQGNIQEKHHQIRHMGNIYSSAQLTIIAAAGGNASFGLSGVGRNRRLLDSSVDIGSGFLHLRMPSIEHHIAQSSWASRAWTFQEGFLSKRRLFFTDQEIAYICDEDARCETEDPESNRRLSRYDLNQLGKCLPIPHAEFTITDTKGQLGAYTTIAGAQRLLREYTRRDLSYDEDAYNGIAGALNTLMTNKPPLYHIWGVPFGLDRRMSNRVVKFGLFWLHSFSCCRRVELPSWSPLGWKSGVLALTEDRETETEIPDDIMVETWWENAYHALHSLARLAPPYEDFDMQELSSTSQSHILRVTAYTVPFKKQYITCKSDHGITAFTRQDGWYVKINLGNNTDALIQPRWDLSDDSLEEVNSGICIVMTRRYETKLLVLYEFGGIYERRGSFHSFDLRGSQRRCDAFLRESDVNTSIRFNDAFEERVPLAQVTERKTFLLR